MTKYLKPNPSEMSTPLKKKKKKSLQVGRVQQRAYRLAEFNSALLFFKRSTQHSSHVKTGSG